MKKATVTLVSVSNYSQSKHYEVPKLPLVDKAARKGYIKGGTAARYKSRLHNRVKVILGEVKK